MASFKIVQSIIERESLDVCDKVDEVTPCIASEATILTRIVVHPKTWRAIVVKRAAATEPVTMSAKLHAFPNYGRD
jgi:hypothetical protein